MNIIVIVDERCVIGADDPACYALRDICKANGFTYLVNSMPTPSTSLYRNDVVGLMSLAVAAAALGASVLQLLVASKPMTESEIVAEVHAFLELRGVRDVNFIVSSGIENLETKNGRLCIILVETAQGERLNLYVGTTGGQLFISPVPYNWRALI